MDIDFQEQYRNMSTYDLLKITMSPESYQHAAIVAATEILKTRIVTQADKDQVEKDLVAVITVGKINKPFATTMKTIQKMQDKWVNVILAIAILDYLHLLYNDIRSLDSVLHNVNLPFRSVFLGSYIDVLYQPVVIFMFYKRKQWGWIIYFGTKLFTIIPTLTFYFLDYSGGSLFPPFMFGIFLNVIVANFLWKKEVRTVFNVNNKTGMLTILGTALLLLMWIIMQV